MQLYVCTRKWEIDTSVDLQPPFLPFLFPIPFSAPCGWLQLPVGRKREWFGFGICKGLSFVRSVGRSSVRPFVRHAGLVERTDDTNKRAWMGCCFAMSCLALPGIPGLTAQGGPLVFPGLASGTNQFPGGGGWVFFKCFISVFFFFF